MASRQEQRFLDAAQALTALVLDSDPQTDRAIGAAVEELRQTFARYPKALGILGAGATLADYGAVLLAGRPVHGLDASGRQKLLARLERLPGAREPLWAASVLLKLAYFIQTEPARRAGARYGIAPAAQAEAGRWKSQLVTAQAAAVDQRIEAEVVVIGSGAGGAAAAHELAARGIAVAIVEAGEHFERPDFDGKYFDALRRMYRFYPAIGNALITVLAGETVGGSTTVNSGTCYRTPEAVLQDWRAGGLAEFTEAELAPYFEAVERIINVEEASPSAVGPIFDVIQRGANALGMHDVHRLRRNAQGCDGQGLCQFGCPTAAKQSTNVSYIPKALQAGALLYAGFRVERLRWQGNRVCGIEAAGTRGDGSSVKLTIDSPHVVVAMGTVQTPAFLRRQGIQNRHLGKHLTLHPGGAVAGIFDDVQFNNERSIPQGYGVGDLANQGIRFEGGTPPFSLYAAGTQLNGRQLRVVADAYQNTAFLGYLIKDTSEGSVRPGPRGIPLVSYSLGKTDLKRFVHANLVATQMLFRAGAKRVNAFVVRGYPLMESEQEVEPFFDRHWKAGDFNITAYHPLGTARLGATPELGVCNGDHQVYGYPGLYVMDGSSVPTSLGINPQLTIMSLATRAARKLADRIGRGQGSGV